jgi:hypothetical protein
VEPLSRLVAVMVERSLQRFGELVDKFVVLA